MRAIRGVELDLDLSGVKPIRLQPYRWSPVKMEGGRKLLDDFLEQGLIEPATSAWGAPALLVLKPHTTPAEYRLVVDFRELNKCMIHDTFEPPSCDLCISWLAGKPCRSVGDMRSGFHQCKMSKRMQQYFTFVTPIGTYNYTRLVMGFINAVTLSADDEKASDAFNQKPKSIPYQTRHGDPGCTCHLRNTSPSAPSATESADDRSEPDTARTCR